MNMEKISILGLGLIGGSLAKALKRTNPKFHITGYDTDLDNCQAALSAGAIDQIADSMEFAMANAQVIWICTPIQSISDLLETASRHAQPGTLLTDAGSIKEEILKKAGQLLPDNVYFIGGHPMAGTERSGFAASMAHLFENAYYVITPLSDTPPKVVDDFRALVASTGALPIILDAEIHDRTVGAVSHLPHVVAAALVNTVAGLSDPDQVLEKLAAGGFKDITRIASSNPQMWKDISLFNKQQLLPLITGMIRELYDFGLLLEKEETKGMEAFYQTAKTFRDRLPSAQSLYLLSYYELYVDVEDKPGIIGTVTTLLGSQGINIKNIRIINSREEEPGCLVLTLPTAQSRTDARQLLNAHGCSAYEL